MSNYPLRSQAFLSGHSSMFGLLLTALFSILGFLLSFLWYSSLGWVSLLDNGPGQAQQCFLKHVAVSLEPRKVMAYRGSSEWDPAHQKKKKKKKNQTQDLVMGSHLNQEGQFFFWALVVWISCAECQKNTMSLQEASRLGSRDSQIRCPWSVMSLSRLGKQGGMPSINNLYPCFHGNVYLVSHYDGKRWVRDGRN